MSKLSHFWGYFYNIMVRVILPVFLLALIGGKIATLIDRYNVRHKPMTDYVTYYDFQVTGGYEGEDVRFKVCRTFKERYHYEGDLKIYIIPTGRDTSPIAVYSRPTGSTYNSSPCENKVIKDSVFHHAAGDYMMSFRVCIHVKYGIEKCSGDIKSNIYCIRTRPQDAASQIDYYQQLIKQLQDGQQVDAGSLAPIQGNNSTTNNTTTNNTTNNVQEAPKTHEVCTINILGIKSGCRQVAN